MRRRGRRYRWPRGAGGAAGVARARPWRRHFLPSSPLPCRPAL